MSGDLLQTKLHTPSIRPSFVPRPHLTQRLNQSLQLSYKLTLVSAPAGFGKTTLVSSWAHHLRDEAAFDVAWLSLDENDSEPERFLVYLVTAVHQATRSDTPIGKSALAQLQTPQAPAESILTAFINDIVSSQRTIVLVLDDYHLIDAAAVDDALTFLLDHSPPQLIIVVVTRADPQLPLARMRANGILNELRAVDLRFTSVEIAEFLNHAMGLGLSTADLALLEERTEGWIAGLQLAALALQGATAAPQPGQTADLIQSFSGSHRFVLDYLIEEVLAQQPAELQRFLLETAVLDQLTGPLCDALTGQNNGQVTLHQLEQANLFVVPLDGERRWYRYHHLFAELLRERLQQSLLTATDPFPERTISALQIRASRWYEQHEYADEAIIYALRAADFERAAAQIEQIAEAVWISGIDTKLRRWLAQLPAASLAGRPQLCVFHAWYLLAQGDRDTAEKMLQSAETALARSNEGIDETSRATIRGRIATCRAFSCFYRGDMPGIVRHATQAFRDLPAHDLSWRSIATHLLGDAYDLNGEFQKAHQARLDAVAVAKASGNPLQIIIAHSKLAINHRNLGQLQQVTAICREQLTFAQNNGMSQTIVTGWLLAIWGETLAELNELDEALSLAEESSSIARRGGDIAMRGWIQICHLRVLFSCGRHAEAQVAARELDDLAEQFHVPGWIMNLKAAWQARLWLAEGNLEAASQWVAASRLEAGRAPADAPETVYLALARILLAQRRPTAASTLLAKLVEPAKANRRISRAVEIQLLQALAWAAQDQDEQALAALTQALALGEPGGFVRVFVDEGPPLARLLYAALAQETAVSYVGRLLAAFPVTVTEPTAPHTDNGNDWIEPLSPREIEVLQHIARGLSNREIGVQLSLSLNTIKAHTRNIYGKLAVNSRLQAVAKARALGILPA